MEIERANEFVLNRGTPIDPRRGAQCGNLKGYSAASMSKFQDFLVIFAQAHSKINQIE